MMDSSIYFIEHRRSFFFIYVLQHKVNHELRCAFAMISEFILKIGEVCCRTWYI